MAETTQELLAKWRYKLENRAIDFRGVLQEILNKCQLLAENGKEDINSILISFIKRPDSKDYANKTDLELAYKSFYKILTLRRQKDNVFLPYLEKLEVYQQAFIFYAILFTEYHQQLEESFLQKQCLHIFKSSIKANSKNLILAVRCLNLFLRKYDKNIVEIYLHELYFCMQTRVYGIREETLTLFEEYVTNIKNASTTFHTLINYWPWTNKYKFYFLASIISKHKLSVLTNNCANYNLDDFFKGIRLSLIHKSLFSAGQSLVRSLLKQEELVLNKLVCCIIKDGAEKEISNFNTQWKRLIQQKQEIFEGLNLSGNFDEILTEKYFTQNTYKIAVVSNMFLSQISEQIYFPSLVYQLTENCFSSELNAQLEIYKLIVECLQNSQINLDMSLEFILKFVSKHMFVPCADFRYTVLGKFPLIFNALAKLHTDEVSQKYVRCFFTDLRQIYITGTSTNEYQPLSFSLKLVLTLLQCLFVKDKKRISKKCVKSQSLKLGNFLINEKIWSFEELQQRNMDLLRSPVEYDDVMELIVSIVCLLNLDCFEEPLKACNEANASIDITRCFHSVYFLRIAINSSKNANKTQFSNEFFSFCLNNLQSNLDEFIKDPLFACKNGMHLFGYINSVNEICRDEFCCFNIQDSLENLAKFIEIAKSIMDLILKLLNSAGEKAECSAASFQVMDKSLELLVCGSRYSSIDHPSDRKYLLLSFWMTLKACCEIATTLGIHFSRACRLDDNGKPYDLLEKCLWINITVLYRCRHKGAIEAAGVSLGKLVKEITANHPSTSPPYQLLYSSFSVLFGAVNKISTTRRGAGLSIMLHHLIKNDVHRERPLFQHAIRILLNHAKNTRTSQITEDQQHENFDALVLHYLCVLAKDTDLREDIFEFYDDILMAAIAKIEGKEWTLRNAALQLFGAIVPKVLGQKQAVDAEEVMTWQPTEVTFTEIIFGLPKTCKFIFEYCDNSSLVKTTSSIILFLGFLSDVNYWKKDSKEEDHFSVILQFRQLFWNFLSHQCENVRKLAAKCLARSNEFRYEIPKFIFSTIDFFFTINDENISIALIFCIMSCISKQQCESKYCSGIDREPFLKNLRDVFERFYTYRELSFYIRSKLIDLFDLLGYDFKSDIVLEMLCSKRNATMECIRDILHNPPHRVSEHGCKVWMEKVKTFYNL